MKSTELNNLYYYYLMDIKHILMATDLICGQNDPRILKLILKGKASSETCSEEIVSLFFFSLGRTLSSP